MPTIDFPEKQENKAMEEVKRELARRSNDRVQVYNPLDEDFVVVWDGFRHRVRSNENAVLARYIAEKFVREIVNHMIGKENLERVDKENKRRVKSGQKEMDPQERERFDLRTNNPELRKKYLPMVYKGVVEEYGMDEPIEEPARRRAKPDFDVDLISQIDSTRQQPEPESTETKAKESFEKKIAE